MIPPPSPPSYETRPIEHPLAGFSCLTSYPSNIAASFLASLQPANPFSSYGVARTSTLSKRQVSLRRTCIWSVFRGRVYGGRSRRCIGRSCRKRQVASVDCNVVYLHFNYNVKHRSKDRCLFGCKYFIRATDANSWGWKSCILLENWKNSVCL